MNEWKTVFLFATTSTYFLRGKAWTFYTEKRTHLTKGKFTIIVYFMVYRLLFRLRVLYIIQVRRIIEIRKNNKSSKIEKIACRWEQNLPVHKEAQKISQVIHTSKRNEFIDAMKVHLTSYCGTGVGLNISFFNITCFVLFSNH